MTLLTYGFDFLGLHRMEAIIDIVNERSKGLLLKPGFTYEGNLRQRYFLRERFEDEIVHSSLRMGRAMKKVEPSPSIDSNQIRPPCRSTISRQR